jgi:Ca2+-binding EF-hand superfamily protein
MSRHVVLRSMLAAFTAVCLLSGIALAEKGDKGDKGGGKRPDPARVFKKKDADGDGKLSLEEFKAGMPEKALTKADDRFKKLDTNGDGSLSLEEFEAGMQRQRPKKSA